MRSKVQKETFKNNPHLREVRAKSFKEATQKYWDTVDEETKKAHVEKMSKAMKEAWDRGEEDFGPRVANRENVKLLNGDVEVEELERINDYCGVLTESQLAQLNG